MRFSLKLRQKKLLEESGVIFFFEDETWFWEGIGNFKTWISQEVEENPATARRKYKTVGPKQPTTRGKRAIVLGVVCEKGVVADSFRFIVGTHTYGDYHNEMNADNF